MPSSSNSRTRPEVRKSSVTAPASAKRAAGTQTAVSKRAVRAARRAAERRRRNTWIAGTLSVLVIALLAWLLFTHLPQPGTTTSAPKFNCATPTATAIGPQPAVTAAPAPPKLDSSAQVQTKAVQYTDPNGATQSANLQYAVLKQGCGPEVAKGDFVVVNYSGWVESTGKLFDSSYLHSPTDCGGTLLGTCGFSIGQQQVISGWDNGIPGMKPGESIRLIIPGPLAYGAQGQTDQTTGAVTIPPNATLIFDITLVAITNSSGS